MNIVVLQGTLSRPPEIRSTPNGDVLSYEVTTRPDEGPGRHRARRLVRAAEGGYALEQGDSVTVVGQVRRRFFRSGGSTQSRTEVVAELVVSTRRKAQTADRLRARLVPSSRRRRRAETRRHRPVGLDRWTSSACSATRPKRCSPTSRRASRRTTSPARAPTSSTGSSRSTDRTPQVLRNLQSLLRPRPPGRHRLRVDPPGRPGHRALGRGVVRAEPEVLRPRRTSSSSPSRAAATRWPPRSACSARCRGRYAHRIPFIVKLNHNELLTLPNKFDQIMFGSVEQAYDLGAAGVGATIYFGSDESTRQIQEVARGVRAGARARACSPCCGATCATRSSSRTTSTTTSPPTSPAQANHLGVTIEADIIKQKLPENNGGYNAFKGYGKTSKLVYDELTTDHPIDLGRWQVANCYMGRVGLINSGGESKGASDLAEAVRTAVINKRAGGTGLDHGPQGVPAPDGRGRRAAQRRSRTSTSTRRSRSPDRRHNC